MLYRNLLAMETEELLRSYPVDGCVLMGGCDKTTPALVMGALSMNLPVDLHARRADAARRLPRRSTSAAAATPGNTGRSCAPATSRRRTGRSVEDGIARSPGHCMTMGTASTMTSAAEAMGLTLPGAASIPAADSRHAQMATLTGKRIVDMVWEDLKVRDIVDARAIDNAVTAVLALGGSTNAHRPPHRAWRAAPACRSTSRASTRWRAQHPGARQHPALGQVPDGGLLLRRAACAGLLARLPDLLDASGAAR